MDLSYCFTSYRLARHKRGKQPTLADTYGVAIISIAIYKLCSVRVRCTPHFVYGVVFDCFMTVGFDVPFYRNKNGRAGFVMTLSFYSPFLFFCPSGGSLISLFPLS